MKHNSDIDKFTLNRYFRYLPVVILLSLLLMACKEMPVGGEENPIENLHSASMDNRMHVKAAPHFIVGEGASIQDAVDMAGAGGVIHIKPGVYWQSVTVVHPNVRIMGLKGPGGEQVVIKNPGAVNNGINVRAGADNFALSHVVVEGFNRNGVFLIDVNGFDIRHVTAQDNLDYGIYPIRSSNGSVSHSVASGHADAGFYVGQASDIKLTHNVAFDNVIGIEVSNSDDILVSHNQTYNNTAGILAALLPGRMIREANRITLRHNQVRDNNLPNFADHGLAVGVPKGSGILAVGIDHSLIEHNTVTGNHFLGIALASSLVLGQLAGFPTEAFADIEPNPDYVRIEKNTVTGNGTVQPDLPFPAVDLLWDGSGSENCWDKNTYDSSVPEMLPACMK